MNTRIKKLAEQAGGNPNYKAFRGYFLPPPPDYIDPATVNLEKFAQLIVLECMNICAEREEDIRTRIRDERQAATAYMCRAYIKEHFGVEE